ncbi:Cupin domain protein [Rubellimicrobium thermophilum DSM 16684]|uniref:Cupin domain protein n=2 Tax=Rubellimicrobium TaxID=295418 RepID=S9QTA2_9RHOB|nr:Cupin domain protein [Rubellimicrobium thermophilum DSM 16684]
MHRPPESSSGSSVAPPARAMVMKIAQIPAIARGSGILTWPLATHGTVPYANFTTGISVYPVGQGAPMHWHNCDEQVTLLEGEGEVEIDGVVTPLRPYDSTYIEAGLAHCFRNTGAGPMRILWIYDSIRVTRTFVADGIEVEHLSARDMMGQTDG